MVVAVLAACALLLAIAAAVLWRLTARFSASTVQRLRAIETAGARAGARLTNLRTDLKSVATTSERALWALPALDARIDAARGGLEQRRLEFDDARLTLLASRDLVGRVRTGWRALQQVLKLGRMLGS